MEGILEGLVGLFLDHNLITCTSFPFLLAAEADQRDQGLLADSEEEGCQVSEDQEDWGCDQVQGPVQPLPLHTLCHRRRQGRQAQAVAAPRSAFSRLALCYSPGPV